MMKRLLCLLLTAALILGFFPAAVRAEEEPSELTLNKDYLELAVDKKETLQASSDEELIWESDNEDVAVVDENGVVTALKYGTATITVTTQSGSASASCQVQTLFQDVTNPSKYYYRHVYWAAEKGITKGFQLKYFAPQQECTREQMMTFLWRMAGQPVPEIDKSPFPDVKKSAYYYQAVLWGVENGITKGYSSGEYAGKFGVGLSCIRSDAILFLWRFAGQPMPDLNTPNPFSDVKKTDYAYYAILWSVENGIAKGYTISYPPIVYQIWGNGYACLREHMVTFLSRYAEKYMQEE